MAGEFCTKRDEQGRLCILAAEHYPPECVFAATQEKRCRLCGGLIGPDVTDRPMCYGCGPREMAPREVRLLLEKVARLHVVATNAASQLCARECGTQHYAECDDFTRALEADKP